jgi:hypothetical protein
LDREPTNRYDRNAITVCRENGEQIGYINRHLAASLNPLFKAYGYPVQRSCDSAHRRSYNGYSLGCMISFKLPKQHQLNNNPSNLQFEDWDDWDI